MVKILDNQTRPGGTKAESENNMKKYNFEVVEITRDRYFDGSRVKRIVGEVHTNSEKYLHTRLNELIGVGYSISLNRYAVDLDLVDD